MRYSAMGASVAWPLVSYIRVIEQAVPNSGTGVEYGSTVKHGRCTGVRNKMTLPAHVRGRQRQGEELRA